MPNWLQVRNQASPKEPTELLIYDEIGKNWWDDSGIGAKEFAEVLDAIPRDREILVRIHSPGGSVFDGLAIYHQLQARRQYVRVRVDGLAASIASIIAMAGREMEMPANAFLMIHNPMTIAIGDAGDMRKAAENLDYFRGALVGIYHAKTGLTTAEIEAAMDSETWMTGADAEKLGYCDRCLEEQALAASASFDLSKFRHVAATVRSRSGAPAEICSATSRSQLLDSRSAPDNGPTPKSNTMNSQAEALSLVDKLKNLFSSPAETEPPIQPQASAEVSELKATISRQEQEIANLKAMAVSDGAAHAAQIAAMTADIEAREAQVEKRATLMAQDFCAAQGIAISQLPATSAAGDNSKNESLEAVRIKMANETDPVKLAALARKARELRGDGDLLDRTDED